jgi:hypothetical protein
LPAPEECEPDENANLKTGQMLKIQAEHCEVYEVGSDYVSAFSTAILS